MKCCHLIVLTVIAITKLSFSFMSRCSVRIAKTSPYLRNSNFALNAKKKASKFISDDLLSTLESELEEKEKIKMPVITVETNSKDDDLKSINFKDKKFGKLGLSSDLLSSIVVEEEITASEETNENKKKKDKKKKKKGSSESEASVEEDEAGVQDDVVPNEPNVVENIAPIEETNEAELTGQFIHMNIHTYIQYIHFHGNL